MWRSLRGGVARAKLQSSARTGRGRLATRHAEEAFGASTLPSVSSGTEMTLDPGGATGIESWPQQGMLEAVMADGHRLVQVASHVTSFVGRVGVVGLCSCGWLGGEEGEDTRVAVT